MQRAMVFYFVILIILCAGCASQAVEPGPVEETVPPIRMVTVPPSATPLPPTPTIPLLGSPTPTPHPTDENSLKPILRSPAESTNQGENSYSYSCYAWEPCTCVSVIPQQISISFKFSARSVDLLAGDYSQTYMWATNDVYTAELGTLSTQLSFFEDGFELYTVIDQRSCTQERYTLFSND